MSTHEDHILMVEDCIKRESKLTDWERGFIDSLSHQLAGGRPLTDKQAATLDEIWERVT
ncbi:hypothetical protein [Ottowia sp. VDI28]|uniref:hypothetical protein n=1 Tax=Ottowia sp. VDI28 TaxID=3133968 RepID=UPI003C2B827D